LTYRNSTAPEREIADLMIEMARNFVRGSNVHDGIEILRCRDLLCDT
jgi:hypothetical protein